MVRSDRAVQPGRDGLVARADPGGVAEHAAPAVHHIVGGARSGVQVAHARLAGHDVHAAAEAAIGVDVEAPVVGHIELSVIGGDEDGRVRRHVRREQRHESVDLGRCLTPVGGRDRRDVPGVVEVRVIAVHHGRAATDRERGPDLGRQRVDVAGSAVGGATVRGGGQAAAGELLAGHDRRGDAGRRPPARTSSVLVATCPDPGRPTI